MAITVMVLKADLFLQNSTSGQAAGRGLGWNVNTQVIAGLSHNSISIHLPRPAITIACQRKVLFRWTSQATPDQHSPNGATTFLSVKYDLFLGL